MSTATNETAYGRYIIKSRKVGNVWQARAINGNAVAGGILTDPSEEGVLDRVRAELDLIDAEQKRVRDSGAYPSAEDVRAAFKVIKITKSQQKMLDAHRAAANQTLTSGELAKAAGYATLGAVSTHYGKLGHNLADALGWEPPAGGKTPVWTFALATAADGSTDPAASEMDGEDWQWKLRPEVVAAL